MTYQNTSDQFAADGQKTAAKLLVTVRNGFTKLGKFFTAIGDFLIRAGDASSRMQQVEALKSKSDAELAEIGLKRDDIVHEVFKDLYYT
jgi:uncharacterized protein YjiS (DUF1127 family)